MMEKQEFDTNSGFEEAASDVEGGFRLEENADTEKHLVFSILGRLYSFPSRHISEVAIFDTVYPLPLMPAYIPGVINRYSVPYALFDVALLLFKTPSPYNKVLVMKDEIDRIAFLIDDVSGIVDVSQEMMLSIERSVESGDITEAVSAMFNWNGGDVFVLDVQRILARASEEAM
jgi:purine-binding chemotaxis protein CheW